MTVGRADAAVIGILMATHNGAEYLQEQLDSIERQTYGDWHLVVSDDTSTDGTAAALEAFSTRHPGKVTLLPARRFGSPQANFFRLLEETPSFPYLAFCDQDDVWVPSKLAVLMDACRERELRAISSPGVMVCSDLEVVDENLVQISASFHGDVRADPATLGFGAAIVENCIPGCSMLIDESLYRALMSETSGFSSARMHDWWITLLAVSCGEVVYVPRALVRYRQHGKNAAGSIRRHGVAFVVEKLRHSVKPEREAVLRQADGFLRSYGDLLTSSRRRRLAGFVRSMDSGKLGRVVALFRYRIWKQRFSRRLHQVLTA